MFKFLGKIVLLLLLIGVGIWGIITYFPALRERGKEAYQRFGGWTEEARQADPVGFIDHAMERLQKDIETLQESQIRLAEVSANLKERLAEAKDREEQARQLLEEFRAAYQQNQRDDGFPVQISGQSYDPQALRDQVALLLNQQKQYEQLTQDLKTSQMRVHERQKQLNLQIPETRAALDMLPAKREIARVDAITGDTRQLLEEVEAVMNNNQEILNQSPVRTVEELMRDQNSSPSPTVDPGAVSEFLEGEG